MKISSAWWNFRSSKRWKLFLSVDRLKPTFWSHPWKNCLLLINSNGWITEMNGVYCPLTVKRSRSVPAPQKKLMKISSVWWNFRSSKCWNLFLSVDRLKPIFRSHLWKNCFFPKSAYGWIAEMNSISCSLRVKRSKKAPGPRKEVWWRY